MMESIFFESHEVTESIEKDGKIVCGIIGVYGNAKESYYAFITPEAYQSVLEYKQHWMQKSVTEPKNTDPFLAVSIRQKNAKLRQLSESGIRMRIDRVAIDAGLRNSLVKGEKRHEVPLMNGFRRYFNKSIKESKSRDSTLAELIKKERMMGHETGLILLDANYFKTHVDELIDEYLNVIPNLTISDEKRQQLVIERKDHKISELKQNQTQVGLLRQEVAEMRKMFKQKGEKPISFCFVEPDTGEYYLQDKDSTVFKKSSKRFSKEDLEELKELSKD